MILPLTKATKYRGTLAHFLSNDERGDAVSLFVKSVGVTDKQIAAMERLPMWKGLTAMAPTLAYDTIELMEEYPALNTSAIHAAALILYGSESPSFMANTAKKLSESIGGAKLDSLPGQTHDVKADVLASVLAEFFK